MLRETSARIMVVRGLYTALAEVRFFHRGLIYEINHISRYALIRWNRDALIGFISLYANRVRGCKIARRTDEGKTVNPWDSLGSVNT